MHSSHQRACLRRAVTILLLLTLALPAAAVEALPSGEPSSARRVEEPGVTLIHSLQDLQAMAQHPGGHYALGGAIDASATAGWNGGAGFVPIGAPARPFTGSFDGRGHVIRGLFIHRPGEDHVGLFGYVRNATLRNVGLVEGRIQGGGDVGGLVGYFGAIEGMALISYAYATGAVAASGAVSGGLVGLNATGKVEQSFYAITDADGRPINRGPSADGQGRALDALKPLSTFAGWSIDDQDGGGAIWRIHAGESTLLLRQGSCTNQP